MRGSDLKSPAGGPGGETTGQGGGTEPPGGDTGGKERAKKPKRFFGTVTLDPMRAGRDASQIADEVITHLVGLVGAEVKVTLEIEASIPDGAPESVVRIVTENGRTLKFNSHGFEEE